ncbi:carbohydrate kinase, FGGY family protein [Gardnerella vaginalis JCP8108]|uniref:Carbohydrate kinase, FGGY family protein n=2 Tax=Gardnerella vaginalis TaxID=2702 RepID=S4GIB8_GARVA|nr:carbohydrate kinase, FGGY family protein [Gardnerella vaginalis JCP8108]
MQRSIMCDISSVSSNKKDIINANTYLGIELGSTRIKGALINGQYQVIAEGSYKWENKLENGLWTYDLSDAWHGIQSVFSQISNQINKDYQLRLNNIGGIGISAMMHGYLAFDNRNKLLVPFRTWRNTNTHDAHRILSSELNLNIPERWSIAHLYQCALDEEEHVHNVAFFTTLSGYIHWKLTGKKVLGLSDASGMFPMDSNSLSWDENALNKIENLPEIYSQPWNLKDILPTPLSAGEFAGRLTVDGASLLDPSGILNPGIPFVPPEGDAATGMVATNTLKPGTGNVSAGTSIFATVVLKRPLSKAHKELDIVMTPDGHLSAMSHANNFTTDLNAWVNLFAQFADAIRKPISMDLLYTSLFNSAVDNGTEFDAGGNINYCFSSGEFQAGLEEGRFVFARGPQAKLSLGNFMRAQLYGAFCPVTIGMNVLTKEEHVEIDSLLGHGGIFATPEVSQRIASAAFGVPVTTMPTASEGGSWGMAILASYIRRKNITLIDFLQNEVFAHVNSVTVFPRKDDVEGFQRYFEQFMRSLPIEHAAIATMP